MGNRYAFLERERKIRFFSPYSKSGERYERLQGLLPEIAMDVGRLREAVNQWIVQHWEKARTPKNTAAIDAAIQRYPKGFCREISDMVLEGMFYAPNHMVYPKLKKDHYPIKKIFGIHSGRYFQNALQIGHLYVDPANDTVDRTKPSVEILPIIQSPVAQISSYDQVLPVVESYWKMDVYPNHHFPFLSFACPGIVILEDRAYLLTTPIYHVATFETQKDYSMARRLLFESKYSSKELPEKQLADLCQRLETAAEKLLKKTNDAKYGELVKQAGKPMSPDKSFKKFEEILAERAADMQAWDAMLFYVGTQLGREVGELSN